MTTGKTIACTVQIFIGNVSASVYAVQVCHSGSSKEQASFNFMTAVTEATQLGDFGSGFPKKLRQNVNQTAFI